MIESMLLEEKKMGSVLLERTEKALKDNYFDVETVDSCQEALEILKGVIGQDDSIGFGGSRTLEQIGFFEHFTKESFPGLLDRRSPDLDPAEKRKLMQKALTADVFVSSVNAISRSGELVLVDMWGNRNGGLTYGPEKRVVVAGVNKISIDLAEALDRASEKAAVLNNFRFDTGNPCTKSGRCEDCNTDNRLCNVTTIIHRCKPARSIKVILINERLGF